MPKTFPLTLAAIRAAYPEPRQAGHNPSPGHTGNYCVGGAFCLVTGEYQGKSAFPSSAQLAVMFRRVIPRLTAEQARGYAESIIATNDAGRFEDAWAVLGEMLEWQDATHEEGLT